MPSQLVHIRLTSDLIEEVAIIREWLKLMHDQEAIRHAIHATTMMIPREELIAASRSLERKKKSKKIPKKAIDS